MALIVESVIFFQQEYYMENSALTLPDPSQVTESAKAKQNDDERQNCPEGGRRVVGRVC